MCPLLLYVRVLQCFPDKNGFPVSSNVQKFPCLKMFLFEGRVNFYWLLFAYLKGKCVASFDSSVFKLEKQTAKCKDGASA